MEITIKLTSNTPAPVQYWRILHNPAVPSDGRPDVVVTSEYSSVPMTEAIQRLCFDLFSWGVGDALSDADKRRKWRVLYGEFTAFTNTAGFDGDSPRWDYINGQDAGAALPILQKGITIAGSRVKGKVIDGYLEMETLSPSSVPSLAWLIQNPHLYFEAFTVNAQGQARFPQGNGMPVYVPWFVQAGKVARLPLGSVVKE